MEALAWRALRQWNLPVDHMTLASAGENTVFLLHSSTGPSHVLRIHRPGYHSLAELRSEVEWMTALHDAGISVPRAVRTAHGKTHAEVVLPEAMTESGTETEMTRQVGIIEWLSGRMLGDVIEASTEPDEILRGLRTLGQLIASMHTQAESWQPPAGFTRPVLDAEALMGDTPHWGPFWTASLLADDEKSLFLQAKARLMDELRGLDRSKGFSLIHADLHAGNVLMEGSRVSVIDFDDTVFGWHTFDLAVALFPYVDDPRLPDFRTALITGYRDGHALPDNHDAQIDLFLVVRSLMVIGWMWARPDIQPVKRLPARIRIASRLTRTWLDDHI